jgi:hypothetical protein
MTAAQKKESADSYIWMNSVDALTAAPDNAQVRAGVLDILATLPEVKVTPSGGTADAGHQLVDPPRRGRGHACR